MNAMPTIDRIDSVPMPTSAHGHCLDGIDQRSKSK